MQQIEFMQKARKTKRFHTQDMFFQQTLDAHSWGVAMLIYFIFGQTEPGIRPALLMAALVHDLAESTMGDLPAPAKRLLDAQLGLPEGTLRQRWGEAEEKILAQYGLDFDTYLEPHERQALKLCDSLEGMFHCVRERAMGNQCISECYYNFDSYVHELLVEMGEKEDVPLDREPETPADMARKVYDYAHEQWETVNGGF